MASKRRLRRRACGSKRRYLTERDARAAISSLRHHTGQADLLTTYRCDFCNGFHFGHPPARVRQSMAAKGKS